MMRIVTFTLTVAILCGCGGTIQKKTPLSNSNSTTTDMHNAENSLDYTGTYKGTTPAADCPGIETELTLDKNGCYTLHMKYLERDVSYSETGRYTINGYLLTTENKDGSSSHYKIEENKLRMLDADKQPIEGELAEFYVLLKTK